MEITVRGKNLELTPALRQYAEKRMSKIERFFDDVPVSANAVISAERGRYIVEVTVSVNGILLRGEEATGDAFASVDLVLEKLEKQIEKFKTRITRRLRVARRAAERAEAPAPAVEPSEEETERPRVVRVKRFAFKPMSVEEAILQMDLLGHDFFVFTNAETDRVSIVYRRRDGNYGLIEPEY